MALDPNIGRIKFLRSKTAGLTPTTADIDEGELALNLVDRTIYTRNGNNIIDMGFGKGGQVNGNITASGTVKATKLEGPLTGNADSATSLQYARTINGVAFNGTANIVIADSTKLPLAGGSIQGNLTVRDWFSTPSIRATSGYDVIESRTIKPNQIANFKFNMYFVSKNGLNSPNSGADYGDLFTINGWAESSGGAKNSLFFAKTSKRISHYQAAYDDDVWGAPSELAYLTDNVASATKLQTTRTIGISGSSGASGSVSFDGTGNALIPLSVITQPTATNNLTIATTAFVQAVNSADTGSAATALALKTARTINGVSFNGTANIVIADSTKLPLTGGTLTGGLTAPNLTATGSINATTCGVTGMGNYSPTGQGAYLSWNRNNGGGRTDFINNRGGGAGGFDWWNGNESSYTQVMSLDQSGVLSTKGGFNGNAASATKLQTARTINGVAFDGTSNITIAAETPSITSINSDATLASATTPGLYSVAEYTIAGLYGYGLLRVWSYGGVWNQMFISHNSNSNGSVAIRQSWNGTAGYNAWRVIDSPNVGGNAATATKLQTARTIALSGAVTGTATNFDGSENITIATTSIDGSKINTGTIPAARIPTLNQNTTGSAKVVLNQDNVAALTGTAIPERGLSMVQGYHNGYPHAYGNSLRLGGDGQGEIYVGWSGSNGGLAPSFIRNKRDTAAANWSAWREIVFKDEIGTLSAGTATKLAAAVTINGVSFDGSANITIADNTKLPLSGGTISGNLQIRNGLIVRNDVLVEGGIQGKTVRNRTGLDEKMYWIGAWNRPDQTNVVVTPVDANTLSFRINIQSGSMYIVNGVSQIHMLTDWGNGDNAKFIDPVIMSTTDVNAGKQVIDVIANQPNHGITVTTKYFWYALTYESYGCKIDKWGGHIGDTRFLVRLKCDEKFVMKAPLVSATSTSNNWFSGTQSGLDYPLQHSSYAVIVPTSIVEEQVVIWNVIENNTDAPANNCPYVSIVVKDRIA